MPTTIAATGDFVFADTFSLTGATIDIAAGGVTTAKLASTSGSGTVVALATGATLSAPILSGNITLPVSGQIDGTTGFFGLGGAPAAVFDGRLTSISAAAWDIAGIGLRFRNATYTDTSSSASPVAAMAIHSLGVPTFAASNAITVTRASTLRLAGPVAGTNVTFTNGYALDIPTGGAIIDDGITLPGVTFANLPAAPVAGTIAYITNSNTAVWRAVVAGGGANEGLVRYSGANWLFMG